MSDHLTPEDFFEFIDQGGGSGPAGQHLLSCPECLYLLGRCSAGGGTADSRGGGGPR